MGDQSRRGGAKWTQASSCCGFSLELHPVFGPNPELPPRWVQQSQHCQDLWEGWDAEQSALGPQEHNKVCHRVETLSLATAESS